MERLTLEKLVENPLHNGTARGNPREEPAVDGPLGCAETGGDSQGGNRCGATASFPTCFHLGQIQILITDYQAVPSGSRRIWVSNSALVFHKHTHACLLISLVWFRHSLFPPSQTCLVPRGPWLWVSGPWGRWQAERGPPQSERWSAYVPRKLVTNFAASQTQIGIPVTEGVFRKMNKKEKYCIKYLYYKWKQEQKFEKNSY